MEQPASGMCYFVRHSSNEIQLVLIPSGKTLSFKIVLPCSRVDPLSFCDVSGLTSPHSYINVYFSGVRAPYTKQGLQGLLLKFLRLQRVIQGIKRMQGSTSSSRLPITDNLVLVIWKFPDQNIPDHAQYVLGNLHPYLLGFARASVFTVPNSNSFSVALHISVQMSLWIVSPNLLARWSGLRPPTRTPHGYINWHGQPPCLHGGDHDEVFVRQGRWA